MQAEFSDTDERINGSHVLYQCFVSIRLQLDAMAGIARDF